MSGSVLGKYFNMANLKRWAGAAAVAVGIGLAAPAAAADSHAGLRNAPDPDQDCTAVIVKQPKAAAKPAVPHVHRKPVAKPAVPKDTEEKADKPAPRKVVHKPRPHHSAKPTATSSDKTMWECQPKPAEGTPLQSYPKGGPTPKWADLVPGFRPGVPLPQLPPPPTGVIARPATDDCVNLDNLLKDRDGHYLPNRVERAKEDLPELFEKCKIPDITETPRVPPTDRPTTPVISPPTDTPPTPIPEPGTLALVGSRWQRSLLARNPRKKMVTAIKKAFD
jgi:hypothetical protein